MARKSNLARYKATKKFWSESYQKYFGPGDSIEYDLSKVDPAWMVDAGMIVPDDEGKEEVIIDGTDHVR